MNTPENNWNTNAANGENTANTNRMNYTGGTRYDSDGGNGNSGSGTAGPANTFNISNAVNTSGTTYPTGSSTMSGAAATPVNVAETERWLHLAGGMALVGLALKSSGILRMGLTAFGGSLVYAAVTGRNPLYNLLNRNSAVQTHSVNVSVPQQQGQHASASVTINCSAQDLYTYWRNFENLPRIMQHLDAVTVMDGNRSHWKAKAPLGLSVEWDAEIVNEVPGEVIGWRSLPEAQIPNAGSVRFKPLDNGMGTEVKVELEYMPPAGKIGATVAKLLGEEPQVQIEDDLRRFKQSAESGEIELAAMGNSMNSQTSGS